LFILNRFNQENSWLIWQLADSAFPAGGFAHSGGLEAAWQHGEIRDTAGLCSYLESNLWQVACGAIPYVATAHDEPGELERWNRHNDAFLSNHVANRASRVQGRALVNSAVRIFGLAARPGVNSDPCHFAPAFGATARALAVSREETVELFFFQSLRNLIAAAIRLGIAGPMEAQAMQHRLTPRAREILSLTAERTVNDVASVAPLQDIWHGTHDRLYSRLFQT
jgi:urease accessory protein